MKKQQTGKLIVIDGADGSGKHTQTQLVVENLRSLGYKVETIDFPQYENNRFGKLIGQMQTNAEVDFANAPPALASPLYALDRLESKPQIEKWLNAGINVVCDRYVSANQLHQGGKITDRKKRREYLELLDYTEHTLLGLPRPHMVILLDVPHSISLELMKEKSAKNKKQYRRRKTDFVELDHKYQLNARESGIKMLADDSWVRIKCSKNGKTLRTIEDINTEVLMHCLSIL